MKILSIGPWPGPPVTAGTIYQQRFLEHLCRSHAVGFVIVHPRQEGRPTPTAGDLEAAGFPNRGLEVVEVARDGGWVGRLRAALSGLPPEVARLEREIGDALSHAVERARAGLEPDVILVWNRLFASLLDHVGGVPKVLHACDSSSMVMRSFAREAREPWRKLLYRWYGRRHARFERRFLGGFDRLVYIAERDAGEADLPPGATVRVVANGVDAEMLRPPPPGVPLAAPPRVIFHGYLSSRPNVDCVRRLASQVIPDLERRLGRGAFELHVLGDQAPPSLIELAERTPSLHLQGFVDDLAGELGPATVYAAPLTMGGGMKNKVLDAMACGVPVVGTPEAFSGLAVRDGRDVLVCQLDEMGERLARVVRDPELRARVGGAGRAWVLQNADWRSLARRFEGVLEEVADTARAGPASGASGR